MRTPLSIAQGIVRESMCSSSHPDGCGVHPSGVHYCLPCAANLALRGGPSGSLGEAVHTILAEVGQELMRAVKKHPRNGYLPHTGWAVIKEELDELWDEVKKDKGADASGRKEAVQVAATACRYILQVCDRFGLEFTIHSDEVVSLRREVIKSHKLLGSKGECWDGRSGKLKDTACHYCKDAPE